MSFSEQLDQLNRQLAARLETVAEELRHAYVERLRGAHEAALRSLAEFAPALPTDLIPADTRAALAAAAAPAPPAHAAAEELLEALQRIDSARMQSDLLEVLLEGARRFCSRSALLITAAEGTHGWAGSGFGAGLLALDDLSLAVEAGSPLAHLFDGQGAVSLSGDECASLVGRYSDEEATEGLLVPIVLRDRIAAALYADRTVGAAPVDAASLQVLAYAAAQTLELLGLRERAVTPTLYRRGTAPLPPLALWSEAPGRPTGEEAIAETAAELARESSAPAPSFEPAVEAAPVAAFAVAPEPIAAPAESPALAAVAAEAWELAPPPIEEGLFLPEEPVTPAPGVAPAVPTEVLPAEPVWTATEDDTAISRVAIAEAGETWSEPVFELAPEEEEQVFELAVEEPPIEFAEASEGPAIEPAERAEPAMAVEPPAPAIEPSALFIAPPAVEEVTSPLPVAPAPWAAGPAATQRIAVVPSMPTRADLSEDETVMIPRSGMPAATVASSPFVTSPAPTPLAPLAPTAPAAPALAGGWPAGERTASGRGAEVLPPPDLQGPGWAFTASRTPVVAGDEALHEEARRLARLLVSEIKLYNEEQVEEGRRAKDIYSRLREDIDRSRQLYEERVHERVRANADYFQQELVRNLAGGDASALGR